MPKSYKKVSRFSGLERPCGEIFFHETLSFEFPLIAGMAESLLFSLKSGIKMLELALVGFSRPILLRWKDLELAQLPMSISPTRHARVSHAQASRA